MASTASPEESEVRRRGRRRLIGAIALVVLLVVFVPMLLDSEPRKSREGPSAAIPPKENAAPLPAPVKPQESPKVAVLEAPKAEPKAAPAPPPQKTDAPKLEGFAVQVGAFRDEAKLKQSRERLAAAGVPHFTERLDAKAGPLTRLRAGPFKTRAEAEAALVKLKRASIEGKVIPLSPEK